MSARTANRSPGHHCVLAAILLCFPLPGLAGCWDIARTSGETVVTSDIWQIRNSISGESALLGETGDERHAVSLERVNSLTMVEGTESGRLSADRNAVAIEIRLVDDQFVDMDSNSVVHRERRLGRISDHAHAAELAPDAFGQGANQIFLEASNPSMELVELDLAAAEAARDLRSFQIARQAHRADRAADAGQVRGTGQAGTSQTGRPERAGQVTALPQGALSNEAADLPPLFLDRSALLLGQAGALLYAAGP